MTPGTVVVEDEMSDVQRGCASAVNTNIIAGTTGVPTPKDEILQVEIGEYSGRDQELELKL